MHPVFIENGIPREHLPDGQYYLLTEHEVRKLCIEMESVRAWPDVIEGLRQPRIRHLERAAVQWAMAKCKGDRPEAAKYLGMTKQRLGQILRAMEEGR